MINYSEKSILIVDDDGAIRDMLSMALDFEGYHVHTATNGLEALNYLRTCPYLPSLLLLDLMMPVMNGWEFRQEQLRIPALAAIPVIVLSADSNLKTKIALLEVNNYLPKPVELDILFDMIAQYY